MLPSDFDILRPFSSTVKPCVSTPLYGACPFCATEVSSELWNQPRCWSEPSRYRSAGVRISGHSSRHAVMRHARVEPDVHDVGDLLVAVPPRRRAARADRDRTTRRCRPSPRARRRVRPAPACADAARRSRVREQRERHAPGALARDAPVGTVRDHARDALLAPLGCPAYLADLAQRRRAQPRLTSMLMNHCGVARKITGVLCRQQCG